MIADCCPQPHAALPCKLAPRSTYRNVRLIYNPNAGKLVKNPALPDRVEAALRAAGVGIGRAPTSEPGHATELAIKAVKEGADLIIAMGGDGTVNEVLNGMVGSPVPLAVIPGGTANVYCCETGIPLNPEKAAALLPEWVAVRVALGRFTLADNSAPPRHFLLMAGAGLDASIVQKVEPRVKRRWGKLAYWFAGLRTFGSGLSIFKVRAGGHEFVTGFALSSRVKNYGGDLEIATKASLLDDHFELVTFAGRSTFPYGIYLSGAVVSYTTSLPGVTSIRTQKVELIPIDGDPVYLQIDGELGGRLPATIELAPDALTLLMPPAAAQPRKR